MVQKLKNCLIDLLGGYTREEIEIQRTITDVVWKREQELIKKLKLIEEDLKNSGDNEQIEYIARHLTISLENIRLKEIRIFRSEDFELESNIFAISRQFKALLERRSKREWNKAINFIEITPYQNQFLNKYDFFKTVEWKKREAIQFDNGNKQLKNEK